VNKLYYTWKQFDKDIDKLAIQILRSKWYPDYIVGITRGGLVPATALSHKICSTMYTMDVRLRDTDADYTGPERAFWLEAQALTKKILIVDDINDSGATLQWVKNCFKPHVIQTGNVRFATMFDHLGSDFDQVEYTVTELEPENKPWIVFPWEN